MAFPGCKKGCTDPAALNYEKGASRDDALCEYRGCTDPTAPNYDPSASEDDGRCLRCKDPNADNFDPAVGTADPSLCEYSAELVIWTQSSWYLYEPIFLDGTNNIGELTSRHDWWVSDVDCGDFGTVTVNVSEGWHTVSVNGNTLHIHCAEDECTSLLLP